MNIYELSTEAQALADILADEETTDELAAQAHKLQEIILEGLLPEKVESYCHVIAKLDRESKALKDEEKRLAARRKVRENNVANMKSRLHDALEAIDAKKIDAGTWTVTRCKSPASLLVGSEDAIPKQFFKQLDPQLDRRALLDAIQDGMEVDGVQLNESTHIRIR